MHWKNTAGCQQGNGETEFLLGRLLLLFCWSTDRIVARVEEEGAVKGL